METHTSSNLATSFRTSSNSFWTAASTLLFHSPTASLPSAPETGFRTCFMAPKNPFFPSPAHVFWTSFCCQDGSSGLDRNFSHSNMNVDILSLSSACLLPKLNRPGNSVFKDSNIVVAPRNSAPAASSHFSNSMKSLSSIHLNTVPSNAALYDGISRGSVVRTESMR